MALSSLRLRSFSLSLSAGNISWVILIMQVAAGFETWRTRHVSKLDFTSDQVLKIYLSLTEKERQHCAYDEANPHKAFLFLAL